MPVTDAIGDFLTRIRNAQRAQHRTVEAPASKLKVAIAEILKDQGFIADYEVVTPDGAVQPTLCVQQAGNSAVCARAGIAASVQWARHCDHLDVERRHDR
jgi:small subunit ribosomal protein S8